MSRTRSLLNNLLLTLGSLLLVFILSIAADRALGLIVTPPALPGTMELIFPPNAEQSYESADFTYTAYINSIGIRDREIPKERGDTFRIAAIGDSYTYGWGVAIEETWLRRLGEDLNEQGLPVETVNLGKPGVGPPFYADVAERAIPALRPDLVIVAMLQGNDLSAAGPEILDEAQKTVYATTRTIYPNTLRVLEDMRRTRDYASRTQEVMPPQKSRAEDNRRWTANTAREFHEKMPPEHIARFDQFDAEVREAYLSGNLNPYMIDLAMQNPHFYSVTIDPDNPWTQTCIERLQVHLRRIKKVAEDYGAQTLVVCVPDGPYVNRAAFNNIQRVGYDLDESVLKSKGPDESLAIACEGVGLPFLSVSEAFCERSEDPGLYFELDGHLTPAGHTLYAESIAPKIRAWLDEADH